MTQTMTSQAPPSTRAATSAPPQATPSTDPARYIPPQSGLLSLVPSTWIPFIELARLDKPVGFLYLYFPCLAATFVAALLAKSTIPPSDLFVVNILLLASSVVMRGAGCSWNDIIDQELDRKVSRTRFRPVARRAVSTPSAHIFTVLMVLLFFGLQAQLPLRATETTRKSCVQFSVPFILATAIYPFSKRVTNYPQVFLTIPSSWGVLIAFPALGLDVSSSRTLMIGASSLCLSNIAWTVFYDTIYAFQDLKDDIKAGNKSIAVRHQRNAKPLLSMLGIAQVGCLAVTGLTIQAGSMYFTCLFATIMTLGIMINKVDLENPENCSWWFQNGCLFIGGSIAAGFSSECFGRIASA